MRKITSKQKRFIYEYIQNGQNAVQAALVAYDTENYKTATKIAGSNLKNPFIIMALDKALNDKEITLDRIIEIISEGLSAKVRISGKEIGFPDYNVRYKFLELVIKLLGLNEVPRGEKQVPMFTGVLSAEQMSDIRKGIGVSG